MKYSLPQRLSSFISIPEALLAFSETYLVEGPKSRLTAKSGSGTVALDQD